MPRPVNPDSDRIDIRLPLDQKLEAVAVAEAQDLTLQQWLRRVILDALKRERRKR